MSAAIGTTTKFLSNYAREIEQHWKFKETQRKKYLFKSPQLQFRTHLIQWIKNVAEKLKVSYRTIHLATYILDMFMDSHSITTDRLGFVALVCLMLAVKFEELDSKIPKISDLNKYDGYRYTQRDFIGVEVMILKFLNFGLAQPTTAHFAEYYAMVSVLPSDLKCTRMSFHTLCELSSKLIADFLYVCLMEVKFLQHRPSQVAAACILAARKRMQLSPAWTPVLADLTGYAEEALGYCVNLLFRRVQMEMSRRKKYVNSPDQGYISATP